MQEAKKGLLLPGTVVVVAHRTRRARGLALSRRGSSPSVRQRVLCGRGSRTRPACAPAGRLGTTQGGGGRGGSMEEACEWEGREQRDADTDQGAGGVLRRRSLEGATGTAGGKAQATGMAAVEARRGRRVNRNIAAVTAWRGGREARSRSRTPVPMSRWIGRRAVAQRRGRSGRERAGERIGGADGRWVAVAKVVLYDYPIAFF
nr:unnamed protein product [Digitaria exilis]